MPRPSPVRLFFAIELGDVLRSALDHAVAPLRAAEPALAWVRPERLHLTMKFMGDVDDEGLARLARAADAVAARHRPFEMTLGGVGAFPNFRRARVVWMGVAGDPRLELLHHDLELACGEEGFELEGRPFRPHITLARVRSPMALERARPFARAARRVAYAASDEVRRLGLLESVPGTGGGPYRRVHAAPLGGC
jgi:RNA 2',3'-cyclic 3'-phosphodiesterase